MIPGWYPGVIEPYNGDFVREQVRILRSSGIKVDLCYADLNVAYLRKWWSPKKRISTDLHGNTDHIITGPCWPKNNAFGLRRYIRAYARHVLQSINEQAPPQIIHAHTYLGAAVALQVKQSLNIPILVSEHYTGWIDGSIPSHHRKIGIAALQAADHVYGVSRYLADHLKDQIHRPVGVLRNFIDTDTFYPDPTKRINDQITRLIIIGDLIPRKQVDHAIRLMKDLSEDHHLTIVGTGPEQRKLENLITQLQLENRITLIGQQSKHQIAALLQQSDLLLHTSKLETFGLVVLEALCCGVPVYSYDNGGVREMEGLEGLTIRS